MKLLSSKNQDRCQGLIEHNSAPWFEKNSDNMAIVHNQNKIYLSYHSLVISCGINY